MGMGNVARALEFKGNFQTSLSSRTLSYFLAIFFFFWSVVHQQGGPGETPLLFLVPRIEGRRFARFHWSAICNSHFAAAERSTVRKPESAA